MSLLVKTKLRKKIHARSAGTQVWRPGSRHMRPCGLRYELFCSRSKTGVLNSNPIRGIDVCVYSVFVSSCVGSGLAVG
jgi:hypothetical protein